MKWNHLPVAGGIYAQHPGLIDRFYYIMAERSRHQEAEQKRQEKSTGAGRGAGAGTRPSMGAGRRRR